RVPVPRSFVREHHLSTLRSAPECTARAQPEGEDPMNATRTRTADQVSTLTAPLVAARLEEDGTIQLLVGDPADPPVTLSVPLADVAPSAPGAPARAHFVESVGPPTFEGFMLLYGEARLTIVRPSPAFCRRKAGSACTCLRVLELDLLDGDARPDVVPAERRPRPLPPL